MIRFVRLDQDDVVQAVGDSADHVAGRCVGDYVVTVSDNRALIVGQPMPEPPQLDGQGALLLNPD